MKKLIALLSLVLVFTFAPLVSAAGFWQIDMSTPAAIQRSRSFNVQFTTLSTDAGDTVDVQLFQNEVSVAAQTTIKPYGDSGAFAVTVPSDGTYEYYLRANNDGEVKTTTKKTVTVDATVPSTPLYGTKTRNGNTYTITFTVPSDSDIQQVLVYSSTSTSFTANTNTFVGSVNVTPGQTASFTYTAPDSTERFHAVQAADSAGNSSALAGDPNVVVTPAPANDTAALAVGAAAEAGIGAGAAVAGVTSTTGSSSASTGTPFNSNEGLDDNGQVLGAESSGNNNRVRNTILIALLTLAAITAAVLYTRRRADTE